MKAGIDLGGTKIQAVVVDDEHAVAGQARLPTPRSGGPEDVVELILRTAQQDGRGVTVGLPQDPGQAGRSQAAFLTHALSGWRVASGP